ncbi:MAG: beta-propeller fold lactonase family protein, partial [Myxococcales bacterium]|nr:beta-propeller fold lactonase family protein [Myxococcales bacterium]
LFYKRGADGQLESQGMFPTGGLGTGEGIGSQSSLAMSDDGKYLYVVNPGSDNISSFEVFDDHLSLVTIVPSGGKRPVSLTLRGTRLYVVNADDSTVNGFAVEEGWLIKIAGASQTLSTTESATGPAQIGINPGGDVLIVTEKATNLITTYRISLDGALSGRTSTDSIGMTPFGFDFAADGTLVVSEAFGGEEAKSTATSYRVNPDASLVAIEESEAVPSFQSAACWVAINGGDAYVTNTASNTVSLYQISDKGELVLLDKDDGIVAELGDGRRPIDMAIVADRYAYVLNAGTDNIVGYSIEDDGALVAMEDILASPNAVGLLAR